MTKRSRWLTVLAILCLYVLSLRGRIYLLTLICACFWGHYFFRRLRNDIKEFRTCEDRERKLAMTVFFALMLAAFCINALVLYWLFGILGDLTR